MPRPGSLAVRVQSRPSGIEWSGCFVLKAWDGPVCVEYTG